ncbi:unnamed protein product [Acanthosepion pharaonis]|uniref:Uncharacterized protein n=1 Tax=Acanthosepion pharaonis TaxID=158019 RepID=A0A812CE77_ACAPH|nr:unnamed protein product [Sepia pharaonis]
MRMRGVKFKFLPFIASTANMSVVSSNCDLENDVCDDQDARKKFDTIMNVTLNNYRNNITQDNLNSTTRAPVSCVSCKSLRSVNEICRLVSSQFENNLDKQSRLTKIEKDRAKQRFSEIYNKVFRDNVLVDGEPCPVDEDGNTTSEFEPVDLEKKKSITEVMIPALDDAILKTVTLRKNVPKICRKHWKSYSSRETRYLNSVQITNLPTSNKDKIDAMAAVVDKIEADHSTVATTIKAIGVMSKDVVEDCGKLENLLIVKDMETKIRNSETYKAMYDEPKKCMTPQKRSKLIDQCPEKNDVIFILPHNLSHHLSLSLSHHLSLSLTIHPSIYLSPLTV